MAFWILIFLSLFVSFKYNHITFCGYPDYSELSCFQRNALRFIIFKYLNRVDTKCLYSIFRENIKFRENSLFCWKLSKTCQTNIFTKFTVSFTHWWQKLHFCYNVRETPLFASFRDIFSKVSFFSYNLRVITRRKCEKENNLLKGLCQEMNNFFEGLKNQISTFFICAINF